MNWARKRIFRSYMEFACLVANATGPIDCGAGAATVTEISGKNIGGIMVSATTDKLGDCFPLPMDLDVRQPTYWRIYWSAKNTETTKTWVPVLKYSCLAASAVMAVGTTALDTVIASMSSPGQYKLAKTPWGIANKNKLTIDTLLSVAIEPVGTMLTLTAWILGYEIEYTPHLSYGATGTQERHSGEATRQTS